MEGELVSAFHWQTDRWENNSCFWLSLQLKNVAILPPSSQAPRHAQGAPSLLSKNKTIRKQDQAVWLKINVGSHFLLNPQGDGFQKKAVAYFTNIILEKKNFVDIALPKWKTIEVHIHILLQKINYTCLYAHIFFPSPWCMYLHMLISVQCLYYLKAESSFSLPLHVARSLQEKYFRETFF